MKNTKRRSNKLDFIFFSFQAREPKTRSNMKKELKTTYGEFLTKFT